MTVYLPDHKCCPSLILRRYLVGPDPLLSRGVSWKKKQWRCKNEKISDEPITNSIYWWSNTLNFTYYQLQDRIIDGSSFNHILDNNTRVQPLLESYPVHHVIVAMMPPQIHYISEIILKNRAEIFQQCVKTNDLNTQNLNNRKKTEFSWPAAVSYS